jgi:putative FmdB family regulatory protein
MPTYTFRCRACGEPTELTMHVDEYEKMNQQGLECPSCHGHQVERELASFEVKTTRKSSAF